MEVKLLSAVNPRPAGAKKNEDEKPAFGGKLGNNELFAGLVLTLIIALLVVIATQGGQFVQNSFAKKKPTPTPVVTTVPQPTSVLSPSPSATPSAAPTEKPTSTPTPTVTPTPTSTPTNTPTPTTAETPTPTASSSATPTP